MHARLLSSGLLVFSASDGNVYTASFDQSAMRMNATPTLLATVAQGANAAQWYPQISVSDDGTVAYLAGNLLRQRPVWRDVNGRVAQRLETEGDYWGLSLSPTVAVSRTRSGPTTVQPAPARAAPATCGSKSSRHTRGRD